MKLTSVEYNVLLSQQKMGWCATINLRQRFLTSLVTLTTYQGTYLYSPKLIAEIGNNTCKYKLSVPIIITGRKMLRFQF